MGAGGTGDTAGAAERSPEHSGIADAGLCRGPAGPGHLFNRVLQATCDPVLGEAARLWTERTLAMRQSGDGVAGCLAQDRSGPGDDDRASDLGFLTGAAGGALPWLSWALMHRLDF